jgi:hypothetical protein
MEVVYILGLGYREFVPHPKSMSKSQLRLDELAKTTHNLRGRGNVPSFENKILSTTVLNANEKRTFTDNSESTLSG